MADKWKPIETAPKDGSWIDLWRPSACFGSRMSLEPRVIGRWSDAELCWVWPHTVRTSAFDPWAFPHRHDDDIQDGDCFASNEFTHWMPLPNPPDAAP